MRPQSRWNRQGLECPEGKGWTSLFLEWSREGGKEVLNSVVCDNPRLSDLSGEGCQWRCWVEISKEQGTI